MITVTGSFIDADDKPLHVTLKFNPAVPPFPYVKAGGALVTTKPVVEKTSPVDGSFAIDLEPGTYSLVYAYAGGPDTTLSIVVPSSGGPYTLDQVVSLPPPAPVYTPAGAGGPEGVVTAPPGSPYLDTNNNGAFWMKQTGTGNTGWVLFVQL